MNEPDHDAIIIGAGPAGLAAALYAGRAGLRTLLVDGRGPGGQAALCDNLENYPGVPGRITGMELIERMQGQAETFGAALETVEVEGIDAGADRAFTVRMAGGESRTTHTVILASGASPRRLGCPGEEEFTGRGVSYCATCDAAFFRDKEVIVVGGGDTAAQEALFLTRFCRKITLVHRRDRLRAVSLLRERVENAGEQVELMLKSVIVEIGGEGTVTGVVVRDVDTRETRDVACDGVFVFVGFIPASGFIKGFVAMDEAGWVIADEEMRTSVPGVFACGDLRQTPLRQVVTACADGAIAAQSALHYVENLHGTAYV